MASKFTDSEQLNLGSLQGLIDDASTVLIPPERISVSEAAAKYFRIYNPPAYTGPYLNEKVPYLKEVMDTLESKDYSATCLVAPAQSGKTNLTLVWAAYSTISDPSDFMIVEKSQVEAKNFSMMKLSRAVRHSPEWAKRQSKGERSNNVFDKRFKSGTFLTMTWPTVNALSGKTIRRVALSDYDRFPLNIGGEGSAFDLARRRTTSFKRLGMTYVESSPSYDLTLPNWKPNGGHEAPPVDGILGVYNRGDRRRRYWQCPHCSEYFEPSFATLRWPDSADPMECAEQAFMACPHCFDESGAIIQQHMRSDLDNAGVWIPDGIKLDTEGKWHGTARRSDIASFWLKGPAAAFSQWKTLVINWLLANQEFESTGNDRPLKTTINTDQGEVYRPHGIAVARVPEDLMNRANELGEKVVPRNVRCLIASIDVQGNRFIVQVHGVVPAPKAFDLVIIDRYEIRKSKRTDDDDERYMVNPGSYQGDWELITEQVIMKTYPTEETDVRQMSIRFVLCDSGGKAGVTVNAYDYYRQLKNEGLASRFQLVKGEGGSTRAAPRIRKGYPDSSRKDKKAGARGEIPVLFLNTDLLKDWLERSLGREEPGGYFIDFPSWLPLWFYQELCVEVKNDRGKWENPRKLRNESMDLLCYAYAGCLSLKLDKVDWSQPPNYADEWDKNPLVTKIESANPIRPQEKDRSSGDRLKRLADLLG